MKSSLLLLVALTLGQSSYASNLYFDVPDNCLSQEYTLSFFTNDHITIGLAAIPKDEIIGECPIIGMRAIFGPNHRDDPEKEWRIINESDLEKSYSVDDSLSHPLEEIESAFMSAELTANGNEHYDAVTNNDSHFPLSILMVLGVRELSPALIGWIEAMAMARIDELLAILDTSPNTSMISGGNRLLHRVLGDSMYKRILETMVDKLVMHNVHDVGMNLRKN